MKYLILCEDAQSACFIRRFLRNKISNYERDVREAIAPSARGSGEQWVRERYPEELEAVRKTTGERLVVCTDADGSSVAERKRKLDDECRAKNITVRNQQDPVAFIIPRRNIETWITRLSENKIVDETTNYAPQGSHRADKVKCERAARALDAYCETLHRQPPKHSETPFPPSLEDACKEAKPILS